MQRSLTVYAVLKLMLCWEEHEAAGCQMHTVLRGGMKILFMF